MQLTSVRLPVSFFLSVKDVMSADSGPQGGYCSFYSCHPFCLLSSIQITVCNQRSIKLQPAANQHIAQGCPCSLSRLLPEEKRALRKGLPMPHYFFSLARANFLLLFFLKVSFENEKVLTILFCLGL